MSALDGNRLDPALFKVDAERIQQGCYSDKYFLNIIRILAALSHEGYQFQGVSDLTEVDCTKAEIGDIVVEQQYFTRRKPFSLVAGVDEAIAIVRACTGTYDGNGHFQNTYDQLEVEAVADGSFVAYDGDPMAVQPVLKIRGRYRDFANLETPILGSLSEATRVATNVYNVLDAAGGKDIQFFPARFAHYKLQALHGYAYSLAVQTYNERYGKDSKLLVSTDSQAEWWGGSGGGTVAHSSIACFLGDTAETMMQFARIMPPEVKRIALIDFHNDCVGESLKVMQRMFERFWILYRNQQFDEALRYKLYAVRPDTPGNLRDRSVTPLGDQRLDCGVNPRLIWALREAMNNAYLDWNICDEALETAQQWCRDVKIDATGGFSVERIQRFESLGVPVDIYGVGSSLLANCSHCGTNNDYTADVVRVKIGEHWHDLAKVGRRACNNPNLKPVD